MQKRLRIVRDGVPHYVAPWFSELSPAARKMAFSGPSRNDPAGQLGLPIPDPDSMAQSVLDFGPSPVAMRPIANKPLASVDPKAVKELADALRTLVREQDTGRTPLARDWTKARDALKKAGV